MRKLILALDVDEPDYALELVERFSPHVDMFKVGLELFTTAGPEVVKGIHKLGKNIFDIYIGAGKLTSPNILFFKL